MITREHYILDTDETLVFMRTALGADNTATVRFSKQPDLDGLKLVIRLLEMSGENVFGKDEWKKKWPTKREPRS